MTPATGDLMPPAKHRPSEPHYLVKRAAEHLVAGASLQSAAKSVGLSVPKLRELLRKPHNLTHVRQVRTLAVEAVAVGCPGALAEIIKTSTNAMARVAAAKAVLAEAREAEESGRASAPKQMPGLVVNIVSSQPRQPEPRLAGAVDHGFVDAEIIEDDAK